MLKRSLVLLIVAVFLFPFFSSAMTYDNRFFPFGQHPYSRKYERYSDVIPEFFVVVADKARGRLGKDMGLFSLFGDFDLNNIAQALEEVGKPNPLRSDWRGSAIPYSVAGKLEGLGLAFAYNQAFGDYVSVGAATFLMNLKTGPAFILEPSRLGIKIAGAGDLAELDRDRRKAFEELGICDLASNETGFGDIDSYIRVGKMWHYPYKFRRIDVGIRLGALIPTGKKRKINDPTSIPFAGNNKWGIYFMADAEFELREDIKVGLWARVSKRFSKTMCTRVPVHNEPINFGAIVGQFQIDPGLVLAGSPYILLEDIRYGLGIGVGYLGIKQFKDCWRDCRTDRSVPANLLSMTSLSTWTSEEVFVNIFYDVGKQIKKKEYTPLLFFVWDIPVHWLGSKMVSKTNRISVGVEFNF